jgi:site-specific recombinase XerD
MTDELAIQLKIYFEKFPQISENAPLFLSYRHTRYGVQSVRAMVKDYAKLADIKKCITPHKLRSTFGTNIYQKTRDIFLTAKLLGHTDVRATTKYYVALDEDIKREAIKGFSLYSA